VCVCVCAVERERERARGTHYPGDSGRLRRLIFCEFAPPTRIRVVHSVIVSLCTVRDKSRLCHNRHRRRSVSFSLYHLFSGDKPLGIVFTPRQQCARYRRAWRHTNATNPPLCTCCGFGIRRNEDERPNFAPCIRLQSNRR